MAKNRPSARSGGQEDEPATDAGKTLRVDAEQGAPVEPEVIFNKDGISPSRNKRGGRRVGRNEINPETIPWDRSEPTPKLGQDPLIDVLIIERARDGSAWRFRVGQVIDERTMKPVELAQRWGSGVVRGHHGGLTLQEALHEMHDQILERMGVPGLLQRIE